MLTISDIPAIAALSIGVLYTVPQIKKSFNKNAASNDIAIGSWWLLLLGEILWGANSVIYHLTVNMLSCIINILLITSLILRLHYLRNHNR